MSVVFDSLLSKFSLAYTHTSASNQGVLPLLGASALTVYAFWAITWSNTAHYYFPALSTWRFYTKGFDFMRNGLRSGPFFRFRIYNEFVTVFQGEQGRKAFFNSSAKMDIGEAHILRHGVAQDLDENTEMRALRGRGLAKMLPALFNTEILNGIIPVLLKDLDRAMLKAEKESRHELFEFLMSRIFSLTIRLTTSADPADEKTSIETILADFHVKEAPPSPIDYYFSWRLNEYNKRKNQALMSHYAGISKLVKMRSESPTARTDVMSCLLGSNLSDMEIAGAVVGMLSAGVPNTSTQASWILMYIHFNPTWKQKAIAEFRGIISKYCTLPKSAPMYEQLSSIPVEAWEKETPTFDLIFRESLRLRLMGKLLRRNIGEDTVVGGAPIKRGEFLVYHAYDVQMSPEIYSNPENFDPERFSKERQEDQNAPLSFVAWGAGRHPCAGTRFAKLEVKILTAYLLLSYNFEFTDPKGRPMTHVPELNLNHRYEALPFDHEMPFVEFTRIPGTQERVKE